MAGLDPEYGGTDQGKANSVFLQGESNDKGWEKLWSAGKTGWDMGRHQPALEELFERHPDLPRGRAVVPGCGSGYDVAYLASQGYDAIGLDSAATAVAAAQKRFSETPNVSFQEADFFAYSSKDSALNYDHTFLCSFPPALHQKVADHYAALSSPGSHLATMIFPIDGDREGGPPYSLSLEKHKQLFGQHFDLVDQWRPQKSAGQFAGKDIRVERQLMALWKRKA